MEKMLKPIYKICELHNDFGQSKFIVKYISSLWWPFWSVDREYGFKEFDPIKEHTTYESALERVKEMQRWDKKLSFKTKKCTIVKDEE